MNSYQKLKQENKRLNKEIEKLNNLNKSLVEDQEVLVLDSYSEQADKIRIIVKLRCDIRKQLEKAIWDGSN